MSNLTSRLKKLINEPKITLKKVKHKFKNNPTEAWNIIKYEVKNDTVQLKQAVRKRLPIKYNGKNHFTIVSACYNVEKYLDEYFESIVAQSLDFKKHIQIICVDDGSKDNTAQIIQKWQKKYPNNIHYFYKENGGQASARNLGLEYVETEWVTFIDPDDFVNLNYFKEICDAIDSNKNISMIVSNLKFFIENEKLIKDTHPLRYRFNNKYNVYKIFDLKKAINLSASSSVFRTNIIKYYHLNFNQNIRPNFEDGKFISDYFLQDMSSDIVFVRDSIYFYRKREDVSSTIDMSWNRVEKYSNVLEYGFLEMLKSYEERLGYVPQYIQRTALYDMSWYIRYLFNTTTPIEFLKPEEHKKFITLVKSIFGFIDINTILHFELAGMWWMYKVAMLGFFKKESPKNNIIYIENIDREKKQLCLSFYYYFNDNYSILLDGKDTLPIYSKNIQYKFCGEYFLQEQRIWIQYENVDSDLSIKFNNDYQRISLNGKHLNNVKVSDIINDFRFEYKYISDGSWLFMDRDVQADDNAEHLYRFIKNNYPNQNIYFALRKNSHDWDRLEQQGFNLVDYGSKEFERALCKSSIIISSHLDRYINNYFGDDYQYSKKFVFLQHGITQNNISSWFNQKKNIQLLVTATRDEYNSIANGKEYKLSEKEVKLLGFPRHDSLLLNDCSENIILVMPTWRESIVGNVIADGNDREINHSFMTTEYAINWYEFLHSNELKTMSDKYGYKVFFAPHKNIEVYIKKFDLPEYINIWTASSSKESMQELFQRSKLMITDYSSVAFEMAYINKAIIYFQFDRDIIFSGAHITKQGYFTYEEKGFGPVVETVEELIQELKCLLDNNGKPLEPYKSRIENTFPFRDGKNCERVYQAIKALNEPETKQIDLGVLRDYVESAYQHKEWDLLLSRCELLEQYGDENDQIKAKSLRLEALLGIRQFAELDSALVGYRDEQHILSLKARKAFFQQQWKNSCELFESMKQLSDNDYLILAQCYAELHQTDELDSLLAKIELDESRDVIAQCYLAISEDRWSYVVELLEQHLPNWDIDLLKRDKPQLLLSRAYRKLNDFTSAHNQLVAYEKHTTNDIDCEIEIAHLAFTREHYEKVINQLDKTNIDIIAFSAESLNEYLISLDKCSKGYQLEKCISLLEGYDCIESKSAMVVSNILIVQENWKKLEQFAMKYYSKDMPELIYPLVLSKARLGKLDEAYKLHIKPTENSEYGYFDIISEIAIQFEKFDLAKYCIQNMLSKFPTRNRESNLNKLIYLSK